MGISKVMGNRVATATKAMASNMDMASNKVMGTASHKVMAMAATRAMDNRVAMVAIRLMVGTKAMAMRAMVATKDMAMRAMVATKATAVSLIRVMANKATVTNRDTANKAMASRRVMGSKATTVATRAMDSKEATVGTKAMAIKTTMVATRAMNSLGMASIRAQNTNNSLATARTKVPSMTKGLATPSNRRSNTIIILAENTRRTPATRAAAREGISMVTSLPSRTVKRDLGTPWTWHRPPTGARATATRTNTERYSTLCRRLFSLVL